MAFDEAKLKAAFDSVDLDESGIIDGGEVRKIQRPSLTSFGRGGAQAGTVAVRNCAGLTCACRVPRRTVPRALPEA
jgi:hypothetical protein